MVDQRTHFVCYFDISGGESLSSAWEEVLDSIRRWLQLKLPRASRNSINLDNPSLFLGTDGPLIFTHHLLEVISEAGVTGTTTLPQFWSLRYEHSDSRWRNRRWRTDLGLERNGISLRFAIRLTRRIEGDWFGKEPEAPSYSIPNIATSLIEKGLGSRDGRPLSLISKPVLNLGSFVDFVSSRGRTLPIVLISKESHGNCYLVEDLNGLARKIGTISHVFHFQDADDAYFLSDALGDDFSTYGGAVRVYQPHLDLSTDHPSRHRFFPPKLFKDEGAPEVEDSLIRGLLRSSAAESEAVVGTIEEVRGKSQEQLAQYAMAEDTQIAELRKALSTEKQEVIGLTARLRYSEDACQLLGKELANERYKASLAPRAPVEASAISPTSREVRIKKLVSLLGNQRIICIANSNSVTKFKRAIRTSLELGDKDIDAFFECQSMEQTSNQITNMVKQCRDKLVIYAWRGLKDATDVNGKFKKGIYQAEDVRTAIDRFKQWLDSQPG